MAKKSLWVALSLLIWAPASAQTNQVKSLTVASFNVSMEAGNYVNGNDEQAPAKGPQVLMQHLASGEHQQIRNIAEIIQRVNPDILLLNEFDFIDNPKLGIGAFIQNYLKQPQNGTKPVDYPYYFYAQSNTGHPTSYDLDNNGRAEHFGADAQGYGMYYGQYSMVLLSKYPIKHKGIRTFQRFLWADMPDALIPVDPATKTPFYSQHEWHNLRLSSKSHWDIPVNVMGETLSILASHPTPPVFDGPEDRNGKRNHDEIRFWLDYITPTKGQYIYDDRGVMGGLEQGAKFVIVGDQNASPDRPSETKLVINELLESNQINNQFPPRSEGGAQNSPDNPYGQYHTAIWRARADYVIPSAKLNVIDGAVFWPVKEDELHRLVEDRASSSDHRLVWLKLSL